MKTSTIKKALLTLMASSMVLGSVMPAAQAQRYYNDSRYYRQQNAHPYLKTAAIGGLGGGVLGAVLARDGSTGDGAVKGALLGAGVGLGYQYLKQKGYINGFNGF